MVSPSSSQLGAALIFMTGRNCDRYVKRAIASIAEQTLDAVHILFIDDASTDETASIAQAELTRLFPDKHTLISNELQYGKARNAWEHLRPRAGKTDFIAVVDADDQLISPTILERMRQFYIAGHDVVWTNYATDSGFIGGNKALDPNVPPRRQGWKTSHFFSFRAELLLTVPVEYFQNSQGEWLKAACDIALAMPILDQTRRYKFIPENAYRYTATNPASHHNMDPNSRGLNSTIQQSSAKEVFSKTPLPLLRPLVASSGIAQKSETMQPSKQSQPIALANKSLAWDELTSKTLIERHPSLLKAIVFAGEAQLAPLQILGLSELLLAYGGDAKILHIGATRSALVLAALTEGSGRSLTFMSTSAPEADELTHRLALCGFSDVEVVQTPLVTHTLGKIEGAFPDVQVLKAEQSFNFILADLSPSLPEGSALVSLPALAERFSREGFVFGLIGVSRDVEEQALSSWKANGTGLKFCSNAIGGSGLLVSAGR
ncbi:glycosyltransferase family A protein [Neorhizobium sp. JUb45]|uniref:glycosyltransferase family 2 protein n=1 Tax=unclassified Neorhizobium TaxID=2629175 RepID=UPI001051B67C|nr:glycosyltransferase family A protein [Neorhizobium sp. JUb45]TCR03977.1 glycosyl transferase family 2 [Neorhizobium sp. JUb45]